MYQVEQKELEEEAYYRCYCNYVPTEQNGETGLAQALRIAVEDMTVVVHGGLWFPELLMEKPAKVGEVKW